MEPTSDEDLQNSEHRLIVRVGDTVRRPAGWWTPAVQILLQHLQDVGFPYAPRPGGIDSQGREMVSHIPGDSGAIGWYRIHSDQGLRRFASLLRGYHDAVRDFRPNTDLEWALRPADPREVVCHNDFGPWNLVYDEDEPVGILDWDFAAPGPRSNDIAYARVRRPVSQRRNRKVVAPLRRRAEPKSAPGGLRRRIRAHLDRRAG